MVGKRVEAKVGRKKNDSRGEIHNNVRATAENNKNNSNNNNNNDNNDNSNNNRRKQGDTCSDEAFYRF